MNTPDAHAMQSQIDRLWRKHMMAVAPVRISASDDTGPIHKSQVQVNGTPEQIDNVATMHFYGFHSVPPEQSDATAIFISGQRSNAIVVGTNHQQSRPRKYDPGEVSLFNQFGATIKLDKNNNISYTAKTMQMTSDQALTLTSSNQNINLNAKQLAFGCDTHVNGTVTAHDFVTSSGQSASDRIAALEARVAALEARFAE